MDNELILELWARIKSHISSKERIDVANTILEVFQEFELIDESFLEEDLDKEMLAAAAERWPDEFAILTNEDDDGFEDDNGFGY